MSENSSLGNGTSINALGPELAPKKTGDVIKTCSSLGFSLFWQLIKILKTFLRVISAGTIISVQCGRGSQA